MIIKVNIGKLRYPITIIERGNRLDVSFPYQKQLVEEVKSMAGAKWDPDAKKWSIENCGRNWFQFKYLSGEVDPYKVYDQELVQIPRSPRHNADKQADVMPYAMQFDMAAHMLTRRQCVIAGEMGTGKSLSLILAAEMSGISDWWFVSNKAGVRALNRELRIWGSNLRPEVMTYDALVKRVEKWRPGDKAPRGLALDECQKVKNATTKRSQAALHVATSMRNDHGYDNVYVILMSGTPAPKSPVDWWTPCEIACPGFIREGTPDKFKRRLALIVNRENTITGGSFPQLLSWLDDERKCAVCGKLKDEGSHDIMAALASADAQPPHDWKPSINEVSKLYERLKGLVMIKFKKDNLDLPEKIYKIIRLAPSKDILRIAKTITDTAPTVIQGLTNLRELSDGFQYKEKLVGTEVCPVCRGQKELVGPVEVPSSCPNCADGSCLNHQPRFTEEVRPCDGCSGTGEKARYERQTIEVPTPKEDALREILDDHEDIGRLVVFAGFTGSIDRCVRIAHEMDWSTIRVDGRGWEVVDSKGVSITDDPLDIFQQLKDKHEKVCYIGHPQSGGTSVTLTASPTIVYYSNSFSGEDRMQSEDRIHRPGMDINRGATIIDLFHLPTDEKVYENLRKKRELQAMSLGECAEALRNAITEERVL